MIGPKPQLDPPNPVDVCGFPLRPLDVASLIDLLVNRAIHRRRTTACYLNVHTFNLARDDGRFRQTLLESDVLYADGMGIVWAARLLGANLPARLSSADYFDTFCRRCVEANLSLFLLGGREGVSSRAAEAAARRVPGLRIAGTASGYFSKHDAADIVERVNRSGADILLVGMGSPRQEFFLAEQAQGLAPPVRWAVGALMDYYAGVESRAPGWMTRHGFEWLYRLGADPRRKWRRYVLGNPRFLAAVLGQWARQGGRGNERCRASSASLE